MQFQKLNSSLLIPPPPRLEVSPIDPHIYFIINILDIKAINNYFFNQNTSEKTAIKPVKK
jgi:hypothetical protein